MRPGATWDASAAEGAQAKPLAWKQRQRARAEVRAIDAIASLVTPEARAEGYYAGQAVPRSSIVEDRASKLTINDVVIHCGGTAGERWFAKDCRAVRGTTAAGIQYGRALWHRAGVLSAIDPTAERLQCMEGPSQYEAIDELFDLTKRESRQY